MPTRSKVWGKTRYLSFLGLFLSLVALYWAYSYEVSIGTVELGIIYPYRDYTILLTLISITLSAVFIYTSIQEHRTYALENQSSTQK